MRAFSLCFALRLRVSDGPEPSRFALRFGCEQAMGRSPFLFFCSFGRKPRVGGTRAHAVADRVVTKLFKLNAFFVCLTARGAGKRATCCSCRRCARVDVTPLLPAARHRLRPALA